MSQATGCVRVSHDGQMIFELTSCDRARSARVPVDFKGCTTQLRLGSADLMVRR